MTITKIQNSIKLKEIHKAGVDGDGKDILKSNTFSNINGSSTNESIYTAASAISPLFQFGISDVQKIENFSIVEE